MTRSGANSPAPFARVPFPNTEGVEPDPFGDPLQVLAAVPDNRRSALERLDGKERAIAARYWAELGHFKGAPGEMEPFLAYLEHSKFAPTADAAMTGQAGREALVRGFSFSALCEAWFQAGPWDDDMRRRIVNAALRSALDPDPSMPLTVLAVLKCVHAYPVAVTPDAKTQAVIDRLSADEMTAKGAQAALDRFMTQYPKKEDR